MFRIIKLEKMKNIFIYYFVITLPIPVLITISKDNSMLFAIMLLLYILYRGFVDGLRLIEKNVIEKKDLWKSVIIPFWKSRYYKQLYFEK